MIEQNTSNVSDIKLKVMEALQEEAYRGIVRIDSQTMRDLGVRPGDIIGIEGGRKTVGIVERAYPTDVGQAVIRMDGILRRNARTSIGEQVKVERIEVKEAKHVTIAPTQQGIVIQADPESLKMGLIGKALVKGDQISLDFGNVLGGIGMPNFPFRMGMSGLRFIVVNSDPKQAVIVTQNTELSLTSKAVEVLDEKIVEVTYEDIGGLMDEVKKIREMVELPLKHPEIFEKLGIEAPKGVLLHGPPGTGKTLLARTVANETNANFIHLDGPSIMSKFVGEAEKKVRDIFEEAEKNAPSIIFIDEIDAIAPKREESYGEVERRVVAQLLAVMDGLKSRGRVVVIAATNRPNSLDPALRRPGRFDREIELGVPKPSARLEILKIHTRNMPIEGTIYTDLVANNFSKEIDKFLEENGLDVENLQKETISTKDNFDILISDARTEKIRVEKEIAQIKSNTEDRTFLDKLLRKLTSLDSKLKELEYEKQEKIQKIDSTIALKKARLLKLEKIKKLIASKQELDVIARELVEIYHVLTLRILNDPRALLIEKEKDKKEVKVSSILEEIKSLDLLAREIWDKDSNFWGDVRNKGKERDIEELSRITHGFVGADLEVLCKEAAMVVLRRLLPDMQYKKDEPVPKELLEKLVISMDDFREALKMVRPSALREVFVETPTTTWDDIGGLEDVKIEIKEAVELPLKNPTIFKKMGVRPPRGVLLYGPPGSGKTLLAKAVAHESEANFILVNGPELLSKWVGESERGVRKIFEKARQASPSIIFFDEIDAIASKRGRMGDTDVTERMVNQLLTEIDGLQELNGVVVIAATNRPDIMDPALLRPGRFDRIVFVNIPEQKSRLKIFEIHTKGMPLAKDVVLKTLAEKAANYVGADIESVCREAAMLALRKDININEVNQKNFLDAMKKVKPSIDKESVEKYETLGEDIATARANEIRNKKDMMSYMG